MMNVQHDVDRYLTLLSNKIREQGLTQLEVQKELGWGTSYISQLVTRQKKLRIEQALAILDTIGVEPAEFFADLYGAPRVGGRKPTAHRDPRLSEFQQLSALLESLKRARPELANRTSFRNLSDVDLRRSL